MEVELHLSDNGPGVPSEARGRIFEPFFTTKATGSGTEMGLSMSYDIVTQGYGGTLAVEDTQGEGATFVVTLPRAAPQAPGGATGPGRRLRGSDEPICAGRRIY
jgi:signal transduction histidine kinase